MTGVVLVTGGAGFIGSAVVRFLIGETDARVVVVDKLTYAGNLANLAPVAASPRYAFEHADIGDPAAMARIVGESTPDLILNLAAETHVDRSIDDAAPFIATNVAGAANLLQVALSHWRGLAPAEREGFRFVQISTDEVFGSLGGDGVFSPTSPYRPNSPYAASKAGGDHLVRAFERTYGLPTLVTHGSNTYGPYQAPEKLIPTMIVNALEGRPLPVYGRGENVRDWLHVDDHARALWAVGTRGEPGRSYCIGADEERANLRVVEAICDRVDARMQRLAEGPRRGLIAFVADRPGHDFRYALDASALETELGWRPQRRFESGLDETVDWYLANADWWRPLRDLAVNRQGLPDAPGA